MFKFASKQFLRTQFKNHQWFGSSSRGGIRLGNDYSKVEKKYGKITAPNALYILNKRYGSPNQENIDSYKLTFEYIFKSNKFKGVCYTIYDYKGYMSCGFGIPTKMNIDEFTANELNEELKELLLEAFAPIKYYDYTLTVKGLK